MGRNRKWVLENDLSEAVWRTIVKGPRPPLVWPRAPRYNSSAASMMGSGGPSHGRAAHHQQVRHASKGNGKSSVPQPLVVRFSPDERVAEARARVVRLEAALQVLGEESPEAQPIKEALLKARELSRVQPVGERLDSTLKLIQRSRTRIEKIQADLTREQVLLQQAMESLEWLRDEVASSVPEQVRRPQAPMDVEDPEEEVRRLRAQVAELQHERAARQEVEESKAKKARVLSTPTLDLVPIHSGAAGWRHASDTMQNVIDAADSTLKEARSA